jgi:hypothetical protein
MAHIKEDASKELCPQIDTFAQKHAQDRNTKFNQNLFSHSSSGTIT